MRTAATTMLAETPEAEDVRDRRDPAYNTKEKDNVRHEDGVDTRTQRKRERRDGDVSSSPSRHVDEGNGVGDEAPSNDENTIAATLDRAIVQEGWLLFKRHTRGHWKCRWAVMERTGTFTWYTRRGTKKEEWHLGNGKFAVKERLESHHKFCFEISNPSWFRKAKIRATCEEDYRSWLSVMRRAIDGTMHRHVAVSSNDDTKKQGGSAGDSRSAAPTGTNLHELRNFSSASSEDDAYEDDVGEDDERRRGQQRQLRTRGRRERTWRKARKYIRRLAKRSSSNREGEDEDGGENDEAGLRDDSARRCRRRVSDGGKTEEDATNNNVSAVLKVTHGVHIEYDPETGMLVGLPDEWSDLASAEQRQHKATAIALESDARQLLKSNDGMFGGGGAQIEKIVASVARRFEEAACERRFARDLEAADEDFRLAATILFASGHAKCAYRIMGTCAQMWSMERVDATGKLKAKSREAEQRKRVSKFEARARAALTSAMEYRELAEAFSPIETNMTVYAIERALAIEGDGENDRSGLSRERKTSSIVATSNDRSSTTAKAKGIERARASHTRRRSSGDIVLSPRSARKAARRRASLSNKTSTAMFAEGFSTLAFLAVVSETRPKDAIPASMTRRRSDAQFAAFGSQARGGSSVVHYLSDFIIKIPWLRKAPGRVSSLRAIAERGAGAVSTQDVSGQIAFQGNFDGRIPSAAKEEIRRLRRTIDEFNRALDSTVSQISPALHRSHRSAVDPATRGLAKLERLLALVRRGLKDLRALKCFVWPSGMREGHLWVTLGHVRHYFQSLEPVLDVLLTIARSNADQEKTWWSLQSRHLVCMRRILRDRLDKMRCISDSVEIARKRLRDVLKILALDYRIRMSDTMRKIESEASSERLDASRNAMISFAEGLNKCERLLADVKSTAAFNIDLLSDALAHPSDPDAVIVAVEGEDSTESFPTTGNDSKRRSPSPLPSTSSPGLNRQASRKSMVRSYALESHGIFGVHIPALNLKRFYCHWRYHCYVNVRGLDAKCSEILNLVERAIVESSNGGKEISYADLKRRVLESYDSSTYGVVKNVIHEMLRLVASGEQLHHVQALASQFRTTTTTTTRWESATETIPTKRQTTFAATRKGLPPGLENSNQDLVDEKVDSRCRDKSLPHEFRGPTFQEYLLLYPYKSLAETHELMRTRPRESLALQDARLLDGFGCSLVEYWHTPEEREPFRVEISSSACNSDSTSLHDASASSAIEKAEDVRRKRADAEDASVAPRRQDSVLRWIASGSERFQGDSHRHRRGELVGTGRMQTFASGKGVAMVVLRDDAGMFVHSHVKDRFHHSSIFAGESVHFAGEIKICQGRVEWISNKSGHYQPGLRETLHMLRYLRERGVCLKSFSCDLVDKTILPDDLSKKLGPALSRVRRRGQQGEHTFLRVNPSSALLSAASALTRAIPPLVIRCDEEVSTLPSASSRDVESMADDATTLPSNTAEDGEKELKESEEKEAEESEEEVSKLRKSSSSSSSTTLSSPTHRLHRKSSPKIGLAAKRSGDRRRMSRASMSAHTIPRDISRSRSLGHLGSRDISRSVSLGHMAMFRRSPSSEAFLNFTNRRKSTILLDADRSSDNPITWPPKPSRRRQSRPHRGLVRRAVGGSTNGSDVHRRGSSKRRVVFE